MRKLNLVGKKFGRLIVISEFINSKKSQTKWLCKCICGKEIIVFGSNLTSGHTESCGCLNIDRTKEANITHDGTHSDEYGIWSDMKQRCLNPNRKKFKIYGGIGIKICPEWINSFETFLKDMGKRPSKKHSLDRHPNNKGNYEPINCRWATPKQQQSNRTNNRWIEYQDKKMIFQEWADFLKVSSDALSLLLKRRSFEYCYNYYMNKAKKQLLRNT